jgi:hypothetical protein
MVPAGKSASRPQAPLSQERAPQAVLNPGQSEGTLHAAAPLDEEELPPLDVLEVVVPEDEAPPAPPLPIEVALPADPPVPPPELGGLHPIASAAARARDSGGDRVQALMVR